MVISLEDICHMDEAKSAQQQFHFAMSGKSFDIIMEHFPDMMQKVRGEGAHALAYFKAQWVILLNLTVSGFCLFTATHATCKQTCPGHFKL